MFKLSDLRSTAKSIGCIVKSNGDYDATGHYKLWALYSKNTGERVSPFLTLPEWSKNNVPIN